MSLEQRLTQSLEQRLGFGDFERDLYDMAEFVDIDIDDPENEYHRDMLLGVLKRSEETGTSLLGQILREQEDLTEDDIAKIVVEGFNFRDIDLDLGTKRNVDRISLVCKDMRTLEMTVSIDKEPAAEDATTPTLQETEVLSNVKEPLLTWSVQKWFGTTTFRGEDGMHAIICKEYLPGTVLSALTHDLDMGVAQYGEEFVRQIAHAVGKMIANARAGLGGIPMDSNSFNIIIDTREDGSVVARYCDVEKVRTSQSEIAREISLIKQEFGKYAADVERGIKEG